MTPTAADDDAVSSKERPRLLGLALTRIRLQSNPGKLQALGVEHAVTSEHHTTWA